MDADPHVHMLDLFREFVDKDGTLKKNLSTPDNIHLSPTGYAVYASLLGPLLEAVLEVETTTQKIEK